MTTIRPIRNMIQFQFHDAAVKKQGAVYFQEKTNWGFITDNYDESVKKPRWGTVIAVGPDVFEDIKVGANVLIDALKWTPSFKFFGEEPFWFTSDEHVLALGEE